MMAMVGGKRKTEIRNATPVEFRDILLKMAATAKHKSPRALHSPGEPSWAER
jgi:hypothetical protein